MSGKLPQRLYTCEQVKQIDQKAITQEGIPGIVLMKRAARVAFEKILETWPHVKEIHAVCGGGNNGGDGYIVAALAAQRNLAARAHAVNDPATLKGDARLAFEYAQNAGVIISSGDDFESIDSSTSVVVDAIVGTGLQGPVRNDDLIERVNQSACPVVALDIPTGLNGDTGAVEGRAVSADLTVSFVGLKRGLMTGRGPHLRGELFFSSLGICDEVIEQVPSSTSLQQAPSVLPSRAKDAHKDCFGHVLVIGGDLGMGGAALLAAESAMRSGAGKVTLATRQEHIASALTRLPEVMSIGVQAGIALESVISRATVIIVGPGLGQSAWSEQMLHAALQSNLPLVLDADALNLVAKLQVLNVSTEKWVITPHPGEAGKLLGCETQDVQCDRFAAAESLIKKYKGSVSVLKGAGSLIASVEGIDVASVGNPGMAVAGMGDVLSGVIGGLLAQGLPPLDAVKTAVYAHGVAGDKAVAQSGERGLFASDIIPLVRQELNGREARVK